MFCEIITSTKSSSDLAFWFLPPRSRCIPWTPKTGYCNITKCCTKVCPENITITDNAIIPLKERVVDEFYDPLAKLLKLFRPKT